MRKRRGWIAGAAVAGLVCAGLWTFSVTPEYEAVSQIEVTPARGSTVIESPAGIPDGTDDASFETHRYLMTSRDILAKTASSIDLASKLHMADGRDWLKKRVSVDRVPNTRILRVRATAPDAQLAADIANALVDVYTKDDIDERRKDSKKRLADLKEQIADVKAQVEKSELDLIQYVEKSDLDLVDVSSSAEADEKGTDLSPTGSNLLRTLESRRSLKELDLDHGLLDKTEANPDIIRLRQELKSLDRRIAEEKKRVADENKKRIRYGMLRRDAELNRQLFAFLMKQLKEQNLAGDDSEPHILIREAAVKPGRPVRPRPPMDLALGLAAGVLFGVGLAFLQESLDRTLKSREEIERAVGLPVLGVVHRVSGARRGARRGAGKAKAADGAGASASTSARATDERFILEPDGAWGPELEDFRTLRTNLRFSRPEGASRTVLVTSTAPEEGKTTIATNLAVVMALAGERVLLVDADLRRPAVHVALTLENGKGLTNALVERGIDAQSVVVATPWPNLSVVTAGSFAPNPPEILESARMRELLGAWEKRFDRVIIDTPPQSSVVDPSILAPHVDGVLLVVSAGRIEAERARLAHRQLAGVGARFYGAVVNQLTRRSDRYGGYGYGYGYGGYGRPPDDATRSRDDAAA